MQAKRRLSAGRGATLVAAMLPLGACVTPYDDREIEAVRDYIVAAQLEEVDSIRYFQQLSYRVINDQFVTVPTRTGDYLVEFARICRELREMKFRPDMVDYRDDTRTVRARFDTIRGCRIDKIYAITEAQRDEIEEIGDAPGDEIYLPEDDED